MGIAYPTKEEKLLNDTLPVPPDLVRWWRRVTRLERGRVHNIAVIIPSDENSRPTWTVLGSGKLENEE